VPSDTAASDVQYGAIPFRSMSYVAPDVTSWSTFQNANKSAHTLLRRHVFDDPSIFEADPPGSMIPTRAAGIDQLGLFEARPTTDIGTDDVDYHTRNRLLAKVANHTTNRSNVFAVWLTVKYFEAHQPDSNNPNVVQIGGELAGSPTHRSFFVIDRTRLEEAVRIDENSIAGDPSDDVLTLDWRSLLLHRRSLPAK